MNKYSRKFKTHEHKQKCREELDWMCQENISRIYLHWHLINIVWKYSHNVEDALIYSAEEFLVKDPKKNDYLPIFEHYWRFRDRIELRPEYITLEEVKSRGRDVMGVSKYVGRKIPLDPEQKTRIWSCDEEYYWVTDNEEMFKMANSTKLIR